MRDFNHSVNVLVKAYLSGTLIHTDACGCAAGNLIAEACGIKILVRHNYMLWEDSLSAWFSMLYFGKPNGTTSPLGREQIEKSGYTIDEIGIIETAFERTWKLKHFGGMDVSSDEHDPDGFKGLMCVVDVLAEIHGVDLTQNESAKLLFVKQ